MRDDLTKQISALTSQIDSAKEVFIFTHEHPTFDSIGSSLALAIGLQNLGKKVSIVCPEPMTVAMSNFIGVNKVVSEINKRNFVISLDYVEGSIEKVSYNIEGATFNLVIEPRNGFPAFSEDKVHYSYNGANGDLIIVVDTIHLGGLKKLYEEQKDMFASKPIINIDRHANNAQYGAVNLVDSQVSTSAELIDIVLTALGVELTTDIATNLLNALFGGTNNFQSPTITQTTFELAGRCVAAGGRRFNKLPDQEETPVIETAVKSGPEVVTPLVGGEGKLDNPPTSAPAEWLKPKIFKSSSLL